MENYQRKVEPSSNANRVKRLLGNLDQSQNDFERICPKCLKEYSNEFDRCPEDSRRLLIVQSDSDRTNDLIDENFKILGLLGKGGMGVVYRALQVSMEREVAIKLLHRSFAQDSQAVARFLREAKSASRLNHPNIITLFEFGQSEDGELYLVMELLEGKTLKASIGSNKQIEPNRAVAVTTQICDALQHAHDMGIIHRDLKPDNIFIVPGAGQYGEFVKVLDFGLAKVRAVDGGQTLTTEGIVCGTPAYMSPEQALSHDLDNRSDLYSIAIMLYEMMAGYRPFDGGSPVELLMAHVNSMPIPIREAIPEVSIPATLDTALMRALSKTPEERQSSAMELKNELLVALDKHEANPESTELRPFDSRHGVSASDYVSKDEGSEMELAQTMIGEISDLSTYRRLEPAAPNTSNKGLLAVLFLLVIGAVALAATGYVPMDWLNTSSENNRNMQTISKERGNSLKGAPPASTSSETDPNRAQTSGANDGKTNPGDAPVPSGNTNKASGEQAGDAARQIADEKTTNEKTVEKPPALNPMLLLTTDPSGASVEIDGKPWHEKTPTQIPRTNVGSSSKIKLKKKGFRTKTYVVSANDRNWIQVKLDRKKKRSSSPRKPDIEF